MPDTNPTLYAKWQINQYILSINQNNGTVVNKTLDYNSDFSNFEELDPDNFEKEGCIEIKCSFCGKVEKWYE